MISSVLKAAFPDVASQVRQDRTGQERTGQADAQTGTAFLVVALCRGVSPAVCGSSSAGVGGDCLVLRRPEPALRFATFVSLRTDPHSRRRLQLGVRRPRRYGREAGAK